MRLPHARFARLLMAGAFRFQNNYSYKVMPTTRYVHAAHHVTHSVTSHSSYLSAHQFTRLPSLSFIYIYLFLDTLGVQVLERSIFSIIDPEVLSQGGKLVLESKHFEISKQPQTVTDRMRSVGNTVQLSTCDRSGNNPGHQKGVLLGQIRHGLLTRIGPIRVYCRRRTLPSLLYIILSSRPIGTSIDSVSIRTPICLFLYTTSPLRTCAVTQIIAMQTP